ncbi:MAG: acyltransferase [Clostridia bacterium]|nr:acyltransferase [Clostridia bacterium]
MNTLIKKERNIGLDILRILAMFLITARHYLGYSGVIDTIGFSTANGIIANVLSAFTITAPNLFVLISGYFLVNSKFKLNRVIKIWAETFFYSVLFFAVGLLLNRGDFSASSLVFAFLPFISRHYWFSVAYIALVVVSPILNKAINALSEKEHKLIVIVGGILLSGWTTIVYFSQGVVTGGNRGLLWFMYLYFIGAYINLYKEKIKVNTINIVLILSSLLILILYSPLVTKIAFIKNFPVKSDDSIFSLILSVALFVICLNIRLKNDTVKKAIVAFATSSFGVYLIQENCMIRYYLWEDTVNANEYVNSGMLFVVLLLCFIVLLLLSFVCEKAFSFVYNKCCIIVEKIIVKVKKNET